MTEQKYPHDPKEHSEFTFSRSNVEPHLSELPINDRGNLIKPHKPCTAPPWTFSGMSASIYRLQMEITRLTATVGGGYDTVDNGHKPGDSVMKNRYF